MKPTLSKAQERALKKHGSPVLVMAHRGIPVRYPENTIRSFNEAISLNVAIVEFDVRRTRDGELVVIHDDTVDRTSNGKGRVEEKTLAELRSLDAGAWKHSDFAKEKIPTLRETYECLGAKKQLLLNVEIKDCKEVTARETVALSKEMHLFERCVFTCFDAEILRLLKSPEIGAVTQGFPSHMMSRFPKEHFKNQKTLLDFVGIPTSMATRELFDWYEQNGIEYGVWCIDDASTAVKMAELGASIITSNDPAVVVSALRTGGY